MPSRVVVAYSFPFPRLQLEQNNHLSAKMLGMVANRENGFEGSNLLWL